MNSRQRRRAYRRQPQEGAPVRFVINGQFERTGHVIGPAQWWHPVSWRERLNVPSVRWVAVQSTTGRVNVVLAGELEIIGAGEVI